MTVVSTKNELFFFVCRDVRDPKNANVLARTQQMYSCAGFRTELIRITREPLKRHTHVPEIYSCAVLSRQPLHCASIAGPGCAGDRAVLRQHAGVHPHHVGNPGTHTPGFRVFPGHDQTSVWAAQASVQQVQSRLRSRVSIFDDVTNALWRGDV